mgnify:CR=1 FL=1
MSTKRMLELVDELLPRLHRGNPHFSVREKQRAAYKIGYWRGLKDGKYGIPKHIKEMTDADR